MLIILRLLTLLSNNINRPELVYNKRLITKEVGSYRGIGVVYIRYAGLALVLRGYYAYITLISTGGYYTDII